MGIEPTNVGATIRCVNHFATTTIWWREKDSNLRSLRNGFTVRPIWPLWYLSTLAFHFSSPLAATGVILTWLAPTDQLVIFFISVGIVSLYAYNVNKHADNTFFSIFLLFYMLRFFVFDAYTVMNAQKGSIRNGPGLLNSLATSYSPGTLRSKYHRR